MENHPSKEFSYSPDDENSSYDEISRKSKTNKNSNFTPVPNIERSSISDLKIGKPISFEYGSNNSQNLSNENKENSTKTYNFNSNNNQNQHKRKICYYGDIRNSLKNKKEKENEKFVRIAVKNKHNYSSTKISVSSQL